MSHTGGALQLRVQYQPGKTGVLGERFAPAPSYAAWEDYGKRLVRLGREWPWKAGDWVRYGERHFPDRYRAVMEHTGLEYGTLANYSYVAGRFNISRRREDLTWAHHYEVASIGSDERQDAWLDKAAREGWTVKQLRSFVQEERRALSETDATQATADGDTGRPSASVSGRALEEAGLVAEVEAIGESDQPPVSPASSSAPTVLLIVKPEWNEAAHAQGMALSDWLTAVADEACRVAA